MLAYTPSKPPMLLKKPVPNRSSSRVQPNVSTVVHVHFTFGPDAGMAKVANCDVFLHTTYYKTCNRASCAATGSIRDESDLRLRWSVHEPHIEEPREVLHAEREVFTSREKSQQAPSAGTQASARLNLSAPDSPNDYKTQSTLRSLDLRPPLQLILSCINNALHPEHSYKFTLPHPRC
ncbi:hypothetical protein MJO29_016204 [Puccinia striiformis f. sp. tritici]|nr:hypothetical protein MJO29_016204 [Puccinia striiformis f. sp. tritici]KAI9600515.1 hypothetical protein H4Q26_000299 [Puccinia striiformis f. sp. tritici PST-130]